MNSPVSELDQLLVVQRTLTDQAGCTFPLFTNLSLDFLMSLWARREGRMFPWLHQNGRFNSLSSSDEQRHTQGDKFSQEEGLGDETVVYLMQTQVGRERKMKGRVDVIVKKLRLSYREAPRPLESSGGWCYCRGAGMQALGSSKANWRARDEGQGWWPLSWGWMQPQGSTAGFMSLTQSWDAAMREHWG